MINIDDLLGVRYKHNGRDLNSGFDCYGLAIEVEKRFGHTLPDADEFKSDKRDFTLCKDKALFSLSGKVKEIPVPAEEGDVILFNNNAVLSHIGVYLGNGRYIHCNRFGVHVERISSCSNIGKVYRWL